MKREGARTAFPSSRTRNVRMFCLFPILHSFFFILRAISYSEHMNVMINISPDKKRKGRSLASKGGRKKMKKARKPRNPYILDEAEESDGSEEELEAEDWRLRDSEGNLYIRFVGGKLEVLSSEYYDLSKSQRKRVRRDEREFLRHYGSSYESK